MHGRLFPGRVWEFPSRDTALNNSMACSSFIPGMSFTMVTLDNLRLESSVANTNSFL